MTITKTLNGTSLYMVLGGRLDTKSAPDLYEEINNSIDQVDNLELDMADLKYISSAGLRVLLTTQKEMNKKGTMVVRNVGPDVGYIFEVTGFDNFLTIE
ncbi:STAS domain-containing protein [Butyrivibrio sp. AD3002]|uniref:STAS domain-containing protein n=1 Tax=Butyrivibrio sp. AD3002 TaxID=1280670 RepID=UPI0003B4E15C|nr:STAS domain-containing protein [Butyrivibrio sp. AD3002]